MGIRQILSSRFNMALGFAPIVLTSFLYRFIGKEAALLCGLLVSAVYMAVWKSVRRRRFLPHFILAISIIILGILYLLTLLSHELIPDTLLPFTLEVSAILPLTLLYANKVWLFNTYIRRKKQEEERFLVEAFEATTVSARITLFLAALHFIVLTVSLLVENKPGTAEAEILYDLLPIAVFLASMLLNETMIRFFNKFLAKEMSHIAIVNTQGEVIGEHTIEELRIKRTAVTVPVIRVAFCHDRKLFLCERPDCKLIDRRKTDLPIEGYVHYREKVNEALQRIFRIQTNYCKMDETANFVQCYRISNRTANRMVFLYVVYVRDEELLNNPAFSNGKLWTMRQIEENLGKGVFCCCFEEEFPTLRSVICTTGKCKES